MGVGIRRNKRIGFLKWKANLFLGSEKRSVIWSIEVEMATPPLPNPAPLCCSICICFQSIWFSSTYFSAAICDLYPDIMRQSGVKVIWTFELAYLSPVYKLFRNSKGSLLALLMKSLEAQMSQMLHLTFCRFASTTESLGFPKKKHGKTSQMLSHVNQSRVSALSRSPLDCRGRHSSLHYAVHAPTKPGPLQS